MGTQLRPLPKKAQPPIFGRRLLWPKGRPCQLLLSSCLLPPALLGQTAGWIKMPLGTEVRLGPGDIVLDGYPAPPKMGTAPLTFRPMSIVAKRSPISATAEHLHKRSPKNCSTDCKIRFEKLCLIWSSCGKQGQNITSVIIVRPHGSTTYVDAAYCYRPTSVVCL